MKKINFKNRIQSNPRLLRLKNPSTERIIDYEIQDLQESEIVENGTEMTAEVLNQMQSNIEESCVAVSPTQPETNEKVWIQKGKNLFNISKYRQDTNNGYYLKNILKVGETYTISFNNPDSLTYGILIKSKVGDSTTSDMLEKYSQVPISFVYTQEMYDNGYTLFIISTSTYNPLTYDEVASMNLQLEQGSTATEYEAYVNRKINVDNEKFLDVETMGIETITNENGTAIKFPDGTMICRNTVIYEGVSFVVRTDTANDISRIESNSYFDLGNYAQPFIEKPILICKGSGETFAEPLEIFGGDDINYIGKCYLWSWTVKSNAIIYLSYIAIGRWK